jgi:hypothetical protein
MRGEFKMEELVLDGIKYQIDVNKTNPGFAVTWKCPVCGASEFLGVSRGTEEEALQTVSDHVHKETHAAKP